MDNGIKWASLTADDNLIVPLTNLLATGFDMGKARKQFWTLTESAPSLPLWRRSGDTRHRALSQWHGAPDGQNGHPDLDDRVSGGNGDRGMGDLS
uniref:Uncharacterized protein n=1 Tax=Oryza punctata TaxID=4537 RepID=A0A0E0L7R8_ORYPU